MSTLTDVEAPPDARAAAAPGPYPGPREFRASEELLFYGRRRECADLVDLVLAYRAVVLYAQSGAGKTSLVNAAVGPALRKLGIEVLPSARVSGELPPGVAPEQVKNLFVFNLRARWLPPGIRIDAGEAARLSEGDLTSFLPRAPTADAAAPRGPTLVVIDQIEELFRASLERWREREGFCRMLGTGLRADPSLRVLIVIREDYLAELDPYADFFPDSLRIRYRVERLREEQALEAIVEPAKRAGVDFDLGVAKDIVRELRRIEVRTRVGTSLQTRHIDGEFVEPVQLQVVCEDIWRKKGDAKRISSATVKTGDVDSALTEFYEAAVSAASRRGRASEREIRRWVDEKLITPAGTRGTVYKGDRETAGLPNGVVEALEGERIVRAEPRAGATWYELTHDRFIGPIRAANRARRELRRRRLLRMLGGIAGLAIVGWLAVIVFVTSRGHVMARDTTNDGNTIRELASQVAQRGDPASLERALGAYTNAIDAYARAGQPTAQARALLDRSAILRRLGRNDEAVRDYQEGSRLYKADPADRTALIADANAFWSAGRDFYQVGTVSDAVLALTQAADLASMAGPQAERDRALIDVDLSLAVARQNDYARAHETFDRVLQAVRARGEPLRATMTDRLEVVISRAPRTTQAYDNLARLLASGGDYLRAVHVIDGGIQVARANADPILTTLRMTRRDVLDAALPSVDTLPGLRSYVCLHDSLVVVASVSRSAVEAELRRFHREYPLARPLAPVGDSVPIVADSFLTCEEAAGVLAAVQAKYQTDPFIVRAYGGCPACAGVPGPIAYGR